VSWCSNPRKADVGFRALLIGFSETVLPVRRVYDAPIRQPHTGKTMNERTYEFKTISNDCGVFTIVKFYRSPTLGQCHVGYLNIAAKSEVSALEIARQAM